MTYENALYLLVEQPCLRGRKGCGQLLAVLLQRGHPHGNIYVVVKVLGNQLAKINALQEGLKE
jgi:hypothetical protein